ncbi:MAG: hypothetical protein V4732_02690 [Pseudomonadota bacterium]
MRRKHEQSLIDLFVKHLHRVGSLNGRNTYQFSLDGQDAILGADYIFTTDTSFVLVEFKYEELDLPSEGKKELRKLMCELLSEDYKALDKSLMCHFVAWSKKQETRELYFNRYYPEICNQKIFPGSMLLADNKDSSGRMYADILITDFLNGIVGANFNVFKQYTDWLLSLGETGDGGIEVMLDNPETNQLEIIEFSDLDMLNDWLIKNDPSSAPSSSYDPW